MYNTYEIVAFLQNANLSEVAREAKISRPSLYRMKKNDFGTMQFQVIKRMSNYMAKKYEEQE